MTFRTFSFKNPKTQGFKSNTNHKAFFIGLIMAGACLVGLFGFLNGNQFGWNSTDVAASQAFSEQLQQAIGLNYEKDWNHGVRHFITNLEVWLNEVKVNDPDIYNYFIKWVNSNYPVVPESNLPSTSEENRLTFEQIRSKFLEAKKKKSKLNFYFFFAYFCIFFIVYNFFIFLFL